MNLLSANLTANGSTASIDLRNVTHTIPTLVGLLVNGTWGGGTITVEYSADNSTWLASAITSTADGHADIPRYAGFVRVTLSGATAPDLDVVIF